MLLTFTFTCAQIALGVRQNNVWHWIYIRLTKVPLFCGPTHLNDIKRGGDELDKLQNEALALKFATAVLPPCVTRGSTQIRLCFRDVQIMLFWHPSPSLWF